MYELCIVAPNWLGDAIMAQPAIAAVCASEKGSVVLVGRAWLRELLPWLALSADVHERIPRAKRCLLLRHSPRAMLAARRACDETIGPAHRLGRWLLSQPIAPRVNMRCEHHRRYYLDLVRQAGIDAPEDAAPCLQLPAGAQAQGRRLIEAAGLDPARTIAIAAGAQYGPAKRYPDPSWAHLCRLLSEEGYCFVFLGSKSEESIKKQISERLSGLKAAFMFGKTSIHEAFCIISASKGMICNDSGLMHAAAAMGRPTVALFGATDPERTAPEGARVRVLYRPAACSPCLRRRCRTPGQPCMSNLLPEIAAKAFLELAGA